MHVRFQFLSHILMTFLISLNSNTIITPSVISARGTLKSGGYYRAGNRIFLSIVISAIVTSTNSPQVFSLPDAPNEVTFSCIDITNGIDSAIESSIPCGMSSIGKVFIQSITEGHVYAISGTYTAV